MGQTVAQKLIDSHLITGQMKTGEEIGLKIDQTLTQDATGTMVMLEFEAMQIPRVKTELSAQYVDHNSVIPVRRCLDRTATPRRPDPLECWQWAPADLKWPWPWPENRYL